MSVNYRKALREISSQKNIPFDELLHLLEGALSSMYKRIVAVDLNGAPVQIRTEVSEKDIRIFCTKEVVQYVDNIVTQIMLSDAQCINPNAKIGDTIEVEVTPSDFGSTAAMTATQVLTQRLNEYEKERDIKQYQSCVDKVINVHILRRDGNVIYVDPEGIHSEIDSVEAVLPFAEQIKGERYGIRDALRVYVLDLRLKRNGRSHELIVSRTHPSFIRRLFEIESEEVGRGIVKIISVAREPGIRTKISVLSTDSNIDAKGACVGPMGSRVQSVVNELHGEKIDVALYSDNPEEYIAEAVSPAKVISVTCDEIEKIARVIVPDNELSLAIGKGGINAKLAAKLTGWKIDIKGNRS